MIDLASIRNASFSLTPTGYNPEEVDHFLVTLADSAPGSIDLSAVRNASFTLTPTGYNPEEVDHFLGSIADQLAVAPAPQDEPVADAVPESSLDEHHEPSFDAAEPSEQPAEPVWHEHAVADAHADGAQAADEKHEAQAPEQDPAPHDGVPVAEGGVDHHEAHEAFEEAAAEPADDVDESVAREQFPEPALDPVGEPPAATLPEAVVAERQSADLDGLADAVDRAIAALEGFVGNELRTVREASQLEMEEIHAERRRLIDEAADAGRRHIDDARRHADGIIAEAEHQAEQMRTRFEQELHEERERFEQALADRDAQAQARAAETLADAEARRREADELVASAAQAQAAMLASFEQARASLIQAAERTRLTPPAEFVPSDHEDADEHDTSAAA
jgi:DivIVA domain-containing protein